MSASSDLSFTDRFVRRHVGPDEAQIGEMLRFLGCESLDQLIDQTIPKDLRTSQVLTTPAALSEVEALAELKGLAAQNQVFRSFIGMGYNGTLTPGVIQRNILENPGWYTQYTPYQPEISQGRLEALLNFQTAVIDLTGLPVANASLLDEATAAAEAMALIHRVKGGNGRETFLVADDCHPQTIDLVKTRATPLGITVKVGPASAFAFDASVYGCLVQYPATDGCVRDYRPLCQTAHAANVAVAMACDPLSLALLTPPGELGADVAFGSSQRFGVPMGYGGPHAAFLTVKDEYKRHIPGRVIGVSQDNEGRPALRMALQTREQHIRREKATSNICTAQVLLAVMAGMYCVYHGPEGIKAIAQRVHRFTKMLAKGAKELGLKVVHESYFDTLTIEVPDAAAVHGAAHAARMNFREVDGTHVGIALDETIDEATLNELLKVLTSGKTAPSASALAASVSGDLTGSFARSTPYLSHPVFSSHHSETQMLRYIRMLESRDLSLTSSMIPLGSCTMKLNATSEMFPVTWPELGALHPFAPASQTKGYARIFDTLGAWLNDITGFDACSLQPNSGAQGEYAGLLVIRAYHEARGESHRDTCLIPQSAHGTNPASAAMAGMKVVVTKTDADGNIDMADLKAKAAEHSKSLAALMVTYPSTHGVFEGTIKEACEIIHAHGGKVYMDGANLNAQVGLTKPGELGADVCHINLHKTFCIPHGGGGPGMGPICVNDSLAPYLPGHPVVKVGGAKATGSVSAAPWGSASILVISWMYIRMMGPDGMTHATKTAIMNANYMATRLSSHYPVLYKGANGRVAHECILDCRAYEKSTGVTVGDIGRRLMDYGFHAPTISFPVGGTVMVEPTESEDKDELDRFCDAMISIAKELQEVADGKADRANNVLTNAPHTARLVTSTEWTKPYSREKAAWPAPWTREHKFWPHVGRIDSAFGDRNLVCACPPIEAYESTP